MAMERQPINVWMDEFHAGTFSSKDVKTQIAAGWYDWFCKDSSLMGKTLRFGRIISQIKEGGKVDLKNWYVWFKNNCPLKGPLFDDFRFADLENGEVQFTVQINCCWNTHWYTVWGRRKPGAEFEHDKPLFETDSSKELIKWFNTKWEE